MGRGQGIRNEHERTSNNILILVLAATICAAANATHLQHAGVASKLGEAITAPCRMSDYTFSAPARVCTPVSLWNG